MEDVSVFAPFSDPPISWLLLPSNFLDALGSVLILEVDTKEMVLFRKISSLITDFYLVNAIKEECQLFWQRAKASMFPILQLALQMFEFVDEDKFLSTTGIGICSICRTLVN